MSSVRVFLADDHAVVRAGICNALKELADLEIVGEAGDGPTLFRGLEATRPDCLLIDVTMPGFDPISAIRQIRAHYPALKILVVSAYDDDVYVQGLLRAGVDGYHLKDQPLGDLRLAVQRVLAGERWLSSPLVDKLLRAGGSGSLPLLTERQRHLLQLLSRGLDNQTIALQTGLSVKTIENHLTRIYRQLNVQSRLEAVTYVLQHPEILASPGYEATVPAHSGESASRSPLTILLVDDNARYRQQLCRMVGKICPEATIYEAEQTAEALQLVRQIAPRLILVDVVLGEESGIQCARLIKSLTPQARIVLISAYPDREFRRLGLDIGAAAFLDKKDLDGPTLRQVIEDVAAW